MRANSGTSAVKGRQAMPGIFRKRKHCKAVGWVLLAAFGLPTLCPADTATRLEIHGYLTQAYAQLDPAHDDQPTASELRLGIGEDGTWGYRTLALQFSYKLSRSESLVVQLSHEKNGDAPADGLRDEIELDWAFYQKRLGESSRLRVGRLPVQFGIFNELRDVGTVLPLYRPSRNIYLEGSFTTETLDGLEWSHQFQGESRWALEAAVFGGEAETLESSPFDRHDLKRLVAKDFFGTQLWLMPPVPGLRIGAAFQSKQLHGGHEGLLREPGGSSGLEDFLLSIDYDVDTGWLRGEHRWIQPDPTPGFFGAPLSTTFRTFYIQGGWRADDHWRVIAELAVDHNRFSSELLEQPSRTNAVEDLALGLAYHWSNNLVLKLEVHQIEETAIRFLPRPTPEGLRLSAQETDLGRSYYGILSVSVSF